MNKQLEQMVFDLSFSTDYIQSEPMTFIRLVYKPIDHGKWLFGIGFARCMDTDEWNDETGTQIARGRAVKQIVEQLENRGHRVVVNRGGTTNITNCKFTVGVRPAIEILRELST